MDKKKYLYINFFCLSFYVLFFGINIAAQDFDGDLNSIRGNWFLKDRAYPYDTIPVNSMIEALQHKEENTANYGYFLDPYTSWVSLGPKPYYTPGSYSSKPFAGRIQSVKYMPYISGQHDPNILFIAGHNGGIWKTTNLQISNNEVNVIFNPLTDDLPTQSAGAIGIDPTDPQIIYYASPLCRCSHLLANPKHPVVGLVTNNKNYLKKLFINRISVMSQKIPFLTFIIVN